MTYSVYCQSVFIGVNTMWAAPGSATDAVACTGCCTQTCEGMSGGTSSMWGGGCCEGAVLENHFILREGTSLISVQHA
eukprot:12469206-Prorocentrum_lima.AAC.1